MNFSWDLEYTTPKKLVSAPAEMRILFPLPPLPLPQPPPPLTLKPAVHRMKAGPPRAVIRPYTNEVRR
jgi:hypothetical protein